MKQSNKWWGFALQIATLTLANPAFAEKINFTFLQLNDVYEIKPVAGGTRGGLARVATIRQQLIKENPRTYTVLAGDAISPSALGTAKINGQPIAGQQMIAVLNALGLDYATFGNHEFDISQESLLQRLKESEFTWVSGNVFTANGQPFPKVPQNVIIQVKGPKGGLVKVGLIGVTLPSNPASYVKYTDPITTAKEQVNALKGKVDLIIALTHLTIEQDRILAETIPEITMILGGHEHQNIQQWRGMDFTPIFKADANAKTVYIHKLIYDTESKKLEIDSKLQGVTNDIPDEPKTAKIVEAWQKKAFAAFEANGFKPQEIIGKTTVTLDGLEESVRNRPTLLTDLIAIAMLNEVKDADLSIFNSGAIRIDDQIQPGHITQYDIIRTLPFGGKVMAVEMSGDLLEKVLNQGIKNKGNGGYLQTANVSQNPEKTQWLIKGQLLAKNKIYKVSIPQFLISGKERGLNFLNPEAPGLKILSETRDIRLIVIDQIKRQS